MAEQRTKPARRSTAPEGSRTEPVRGARGAAERACEGLADLIGHRTEGVSAVRKAEEHPGWRVDVDVLEVPRIPDTAVCSRPTRSNWTVTASSWNTAAYAATGGAPPTPEKAGPP